MAQSAIDHARAYAEDPTIPGTVTSKMSNLAAASVIVASEGPLPPPSDPQWRNLTDAIAWPSTVKSVRGACTWRDRLMVTTRGSVSVDAQSWWIDGPGQNQKHSHFGQTSMLFALSDEKSATPNGSVYLGIGTQRTPGAARVWSYDSTGTYGQYTALPEFPAPGQDMAYCACWHEGVLHVGVESEDEPGNARAYRLATDGNSWETVFAPGEDGLPLSYDFTMVYELESMGSDLYLATVGRANNTGRVFRKRNGLWTDLGNPAPAKYATAFCQYNGELLATFEGAGKGVYVLRNDQWEQFGDVPAKWATATLWNHMTVHQGKVYVGVGGPPETMSVWRLDGETWTQVAGDGINGSWPTQSGVPKWIYRLHSHDGKLYACLAGHEDVAAVWEMAA